MKAAELKAKRRTIPMGSNKNPIRRILMKRKRRWSQPGLFMLYPDASDHLGHHPVVKDNDHQGDDHQDEPLRPG